jgi:4'-phosphopantetheinyl transferase
MSIERSMTISLQGLSLADNEVHVWCASLQQPANAVEKLSYLLSTDEEVRAARFHFDYLRTSFIVARGLLRILLAGYLNLKPDQLEFKYQRAGKPQLSGNLDGKISFNLSHSHEIVLYAFSSARNVGIDIEHIRPINDLEQIAERNFSVNEIIQLKTLPSAKILEGFFNCWTRKEAYVKAIGDGISYPLQQFDVSLKPGEPAKLFSIYGSKEEAARWSMFELQPADGYTAALVVEGSGCKVSYHKWEQFDLISI